MLLVSTDNLDIWYCLDETVDDTTWAQASITTTQMILAFAKDKNDVALAFTVDKIYKSTDNGLTWTYWKGLPEDISQPFGDTVEAPLVNVPDDNIIAYVDINNKLQVSSDGGDTWSAKTVTTGVGTISQLYAPALSGATPDKSNYYIAADETAEDYTDGQTIGPSATSEVEEASSGDVDVDINRASQLCCKTTNSSQVAAVKKNTYWSVGGTEEITFRMKCALEQIGDFYVSTTFFRIMTGGVPTPDTNANLDSNSNVKIDFYYQDGFTNPRLRLSYRDTGGTWYGWNGSAWIAGVANSASIADGSTIQISVKKNSGINYTIEVYDQNGSKIIDATTGTCYQGGNQYIYFGVMETDKGFNFELGVDWFSWDAVIDPTIGTTALYLVVVGSLGGAIAYTDDWGDTWEDVWDDTGVTTPKIGSTWGMRYDNASLFGHGQWTLSGVPAGSSTSFQIDVPSFMWMIAFQTQGQDGMSICVDTANNIAEIGQRGDGANAYSSGLTATGAYGVWSNDGLSASTDVYQHRVAAGQNDEIYTTYFNNVASPVRSIQKRTAAHTWSTVKDLSAYVISKFGAFWSGVLSYVPPNPRELTTAELRNMSGNRPPTFDRCVLYQQFGGNIVAIDSVSKLRVEGDATSLLSVGDNILLPLKYFDSEYTITVITYDPVLGHTYITVDSGDFNSDDIGRTVCLSIDISTKFTLNGVGNVDQRIEGEELCDFDSGIMQITVDNKDGYFHNSSGTGIFDDLSNDVFWFQYISSFRGTDAVDNKILYFGGLLDSIDSNLFDRTVTFTILGHSRELERYPAYRTVETNVKDMMLPNLVGIKVIRYTSNDDTEEGVKSIKYDPTAPSLMNGIKVTSVSDDTVPGIKILEFRLPYYFKWNGGDWTKVTASTVDSNGNQTLYQHNGSGTSGYAVVNFGDSNGLNEFPDYDVISWVIIKAKSYQIPITKDSKYEQKDVVAQGRPVIRFDNGEDVTLYPYFTRCIRYDDSAGTYTDISYLLNQQIDFTKPFAYILQDNDDEFILVSPYKFYGAEFNITDPVSDIVIEVYFSTGFQSWQLMSSGSNGLVDGTSDFSNSGIRRITWTSAEGWQQNFIYTSVVLGSDYIKGYMIKIKRVSGTSAAAYLDYVKKLLLCRGVNGDYIEVTCDNTRVPLVSKDDEVVIYRDENDDFQVGTWFLFCSLQYLLENMLDNANYDSTKRTLLDTKITPSTAKINMLGQPPKRDYNFTPHAVYRDANDYIYMGVGTELYRAKTTGKLEFLCNFNANIGGSNIQEIYIIDIWTDASYVYCLLVQQYDNEIENTYVHAVIGRYEFSTEKAEFISEDENNLQFCYPGYICIRHGTNWSDSGQYYTAFGQDVDGSGKDLGENLALPFKQVLAGSIISLNNNALVPANDIDNTPALGSTRLPIWYFDPDPQGFTTDNSGPFFLTNEGYYCLQDRAGGLSGQYEKLYFKWLQGQQGLIIVDKTNNDVYIIRENIPADPAYYELLSLKTTSPGTLFNKWKSSNLPDLPIAGCYDFTNDILYMAHTSWYDHDTKSKSYSYLTAYNNTKAADWEKVWKYDKTASSLTDITSDVNAGTAVASIVDEVDDAIYFGKNERFNRFNFDLSDPNNTYYFEYYDGTGWTEVDNPHLWAATDVFEFTIPHDWEKSLLGEATERFWFRVRCKTYSVAPTLNDGRLLEYALWDSQEQVSSQQRFMIQWMTLNIAESTIHGCLFDRDSQNTKGFQWKYFVFDLTSNTMYITTTGNNYTFNGNKLMKDFVYNQSDSKIYFMTVDVRYNDDPAFLSSAVFDNVTHVITLTKLATPSNRAWGSGSWLSITNGIIYGITEGEENAVWEYGTTLYPRLELAAFGQQNVKQVLAEFAKIINSHLYIAADRNISYVKRTTYSSTETLEWNKNLQQKRFKYDWWKHYYDSVKIEWNNPFTGWNGQAKRGYSGWLKKTLSINSDFIQNSQLAELMIDDVYNFFSTKRHFIQRIYGTYLNQLILLMRFNVIMPTSILDIDNNKYFIITRLKLVNQGNKYVEIEGFELS